ncbi:MAG: hypothetical protein QG611_1044, partial [Bacteroidota bacterium]|nr:hypothetical protein [Bacteroidota bacterium]
MKNNKIAVRTFFVVLVMLIITGIFVTTRFKSRLKEIFKMNEELKSEGYYLAEFEYSLLAQAFYLDHGQFSKGL